MIYLNCTIRSVGPDSSRTLSGSQQAPSREDLLDRSGISPVFERRILAPRTMISYNYTLPQIDEATVHLSLIFC